jgi:hypothetical protein
VIGFGEFESGEVRAADRLDRSRPDELVERCERLRDRRARVGLVQVIEVDVVGPQALERALDRGAQAIGGAVSVLPPPAELRREYDALPASLEDLAEEPSLSPPLP